MAREDEIKLIAYNIWIDEGCCDGRDLDHWIRAEIIWEEQAKQPKKSAPAKATAVKEKPVAAKADKTAPAKKTVNRRKTVIKPEIQPKSAETAKPAENPETNSGENKATA